MIRHRIVTAIVFYSVLHSHAVIIERARIRQLHNTGTTLFDALPKKENCGIGQIVERKVRRKILRRFTPIEIVAARQPGRFWNWIVS